MDISIHCTVTLIEQPHTPHSQVVTGNLVLLGTTRPLLTLF